MGGNSNRRQLASLGDKNPLYIKMKTNKEKSEKTWSKGKNTNKRWTKKKWNLTTNEKNENLKNELTLSLKFYTFLKLRDTF